MFKISIRKYLMLLTIITVIFAFSINIYFGFIFFLFITSFQLFRKLFTKNKLVSIAYFILFLSFFFAYFIRAFILIPHPEFFQYFWIVRFKKDDERIIGALWDTLFYFLSMSIGFWWAVNFISHWRFRRSRKWKFIKDWPIIYFKSFITILFILVTLNLFLFFTTGAGMKGEESNGSIGFLLRFIPNDLIFIVSVMYLLRYRSLMSNRRKIIIYSLVILMSFSILLTGSKIFLMLLGLCFLIVYLYEGYKISALKLLGYSILSIFVLAFSFSAAFIIKNKRPQNIHEFITYTTNQMQSTDNLVIASMVTSRFIGLDGYLVIKTISNSATGEKLKEAFSLKNTILGIVDYIVPFGKFSNDVTTGKAISMYIFGNSSDQVMAGAVGIFGAFALMAPGLVIIVAFVFGLIIGLIFQKINKVVDPDIKLILFYFASYFLIHAFMSGNFSLLIGLLIIKIILLYLYVKLAISSRMLIKR